MKRTAMMLVSVALLGLAQPSPLGITPQPVPGFSVSVWTEKAQYSVGETLRFFVYLSQPAYVYVFDIEPTGHIRLVFPNYYSPNPWKPAGTHVFPDGNYVFRVTPPTGTDCLQVIACSQPLPVPLGTENDPYPLLGPDPQSGRAKVLGIVPEPGCGCCVTAWTSFQIVPGYPSYPCPPCWFGPCPPCYGIWPGMCWHYDPATGSWTVVVGNEPKDPGWYWCLGPDGRWYFRIQICVGDCH